ncbi:MAG: hypothetical protein [Bacteriophage sp.]|nr:MAG: hypothetical protein [Bacteriophage sp.]
MKKFLELLDRSDRDYEIQDGMVMVRDIFMFDKLAVKHISIPENTDFEFGLICHDSDIEIQLPENLKVACILDLTNTNVTRLPSNLTVHDYCSVYLDAHKIENVSYCDDCGASNRQIFAFWANNDFLIAAGCFAGTYSEFADAVDRKYYDYGGAEYKRQAQNCISELAEKLGKPDPFKNQ